MREHECDDYWCPFGRVSIQSVSAPGHGLDEPGVRVAPGGAFNRVLQTSPGAGRGEWLYPARCLGEGCACWRPGRLAALGFAPAFLRVGQCGLAAGRDTGAGAVFAAALAALVFFWAQGAL